MSRLWTGVLAGCVAYQERRSVLGYRRIDSIKFDLSMPKSLNCEVEDGCVQCLNKMEEDGCALEDGV